MRVYFICENCQDVFHEGDFGNEEGILTIDSLCTDCSEDIGQLGELIFTNHYYS